MHNKIPPERSWQWAELNYMSQGLQYTRRSDLSGSETALIQVPGMEELEIPACNPTSKTFILAKSSKHHNKDNISNNSQSCVQSSSISQSSTNMQYIWQMSRTAGNTFKICLYYNNSKLNYWYCTDVNKLKTSVKQIHIVTEANIVTTVYVHNI